MDRIVLNEQELVSIYDNIYKQGMIWFVLGSHISSENFWEINKATSEKSYSDLLEVYEYHISKLQNIAKIIDKTNIPLSDQQKIKDYALGGLGILKKEMKSKKKQWKNIQKKITTNN